jgi:hypothetical protein
VSRDGVVLHLTEHHGDCCPGSTVFVLLALAVGCAVVPWFLR